VGCTVPGVDSRGAPIRSGEASTARTSVAGLRIRDLIRLTALGLQVWLALRAERSFAALPTLESEHGLSSGRQRWSLGRGKAAWGSPSPRRERASPKPVANGPEAQPPSVSIIVPARNEEQNLRRLLPSLASLSYPHRDLTVVDDGSSDATAAVAAGLGARVLAAGTLPDGWVGKSYACWVGARAANAEWLLFTDADTWHAPDSLGRALAAAERRGLDAVSLFTEQECRSLWESLLLPFAYQHYFAGLRPRALADPRSCAVLLNGQYLLVRRAAYFSSGGHAAVRASLVEDAALGTLFKRTGVTYTTLRASGAVRVRMYAGFAGIWEGFAKNCARFLAVDPLGGALTVMSTLVSAMSLLLLAGATVRLRRRPVSEAVAPLLIGASSYLVSVAAFARWQRRFCARLRFAPLQPLAAVVFQAIGIRSAVRALTGSGTRWKGRVYRL
jgi:chlorobactene glucosyltransferase